MARRKRQLDGRFEIVTPENIGFEYRAAGPFYRLPAYLIDVAIRALVVWVLYSLVLPLFVVVRLFGLGIGILLVTWFVLEWFYGGLFETFWNGQTPGKRMMKLRVVSVDGQPINALQAVLRNLLRAVDGMPFFPLGVGLPIPCCQVGLLSCLSNDRYQRLGDLACGTVVIVEERQGLYGVTRVDDREAIELAGRLPPNFIVRRSLARALSKYVERRAYFAPARRAEIARHLSDPLIERLELPADTPGDLLLTALYYRVFLADRNGASRNGGRPDEEALPLDAIAQLGPRAPVVTEAPMLDVPPLNLPGR
jgi:uncharacterized RDD family membrane protein YckC